MTHRVFACVAVVVAGCYSPSFSDCEVRCSDSSGCPSGFACGDEGRCRPTSAMATCQALLEDARAGGREVVLEASARRELDLLFVVDDSATMVNKQTAVGVGVGSLFAELERFAPLPSLHVGVISSDMGTKGSASATPAPPVGGICAGAGKNGVLQTGTALVDDRYLIDAPLGSGRDTNYSGGTLAETVGDMVALGAAGCGFEQHLHAMRVGLLNRVENVGFRRPGANLAVIVIADEDDCSVRDPGMFGPASTELGPQDGHRCFRFGVRCSPDTPTAVGTKQGCVPRPGPTLLDDFASFRDFLVEAAGDPRALMFGVVAGEPAPVVVELAPSSSNPALAPACEYTTANGVPDEAAPSVRFDALVRSFAGPARFETVCKADLGPPLAAMGATMRKLVGDNCLERPIALPADCVVDDEVGGLPTRVPACDGATTTDCFELVEEPTRCAAVSQHLRLVVRRSGAAPADATTVVRCKLPA